MKRGIENDIALFLYFILSWLVSMSAADFVINECYKTTTTAVATRRTAKDRQLNFLNHCKYNPRVTHVAPHYQPTNILFRIEPMNL